MLNNSLHTQLHQAVERAGRQQDYRKVDCFYILHTPEIDDSLVFTDYDRCMEHYEAYWKSDSGFIGLTTINIPLNYFSRCTDDEVYDSWLEWKRETDPTWARHDAECQRADDLCSERGL